MCLAEDVHTSCAYLIRLQRVKVGGVEPFIQSHVITVKGEQGAAEEV
jgi:hypothetical protein